MTLTNATIRPADLDLVDAVRAAEAVRKPLCSAADGLVPCRAEALGGTTVCVRHAWSHQLTAHQVWLTKS